MTPEQVSNALKLADFALNSEGSTQREIELASLALHLAEKLESMKPYEKMALQLTDAMTRRGWSHCTGGQELIAQIDSEITARELAEARLAKAREWMEKRGHPAECFSNVRYLPAGLDMTAENIRKCHCTCGLDAAIKGEP